MRWEIGDEVSQADRDELTRSARMVHDYAASIGLPSIEGSVKFYIYGDLDALVDAAVDAYGASWGGENRWSRCGWRGGREFLFWHMCHVGEATENFAHSLAGFYVDEMQSPRVTFGPVWLRNGFDLFFVGRAWSFREKRDYYTPRRSDHVERVKEEDDRPLKERETREGFYETSSFNHAFLAADLLASRAGESSLMRFYALSEPGTDWRITFQSAFGLTVDEFYDLFEAHRAAGFPETEIRKTPPEPIPVVTPAPIPYIAWEVGDGVSQSDLRVVMSGARIMHNYVERIGLPAIDGALRFYVYDDLDALTEAYARVTGSEVRWQDDWSVLAWDAYTFLYASHAWYASLEYGENQLAFLAKLLHQAYQNKLIQEHKGAAWLSEGSAEFAARRALSLDLWFDPVNHWQYRSDRYRIARGAKRVDTPLRDMESWADFPGGDAYSYSMMAAELLASRAGEGAILRYYALLTSDWRDAFKSAFGLTVDDFYVLFEAHRAAGFPALEIPASAP